MARAALQHSPLVFVALFLVTVAESRCIIHTFANLAHDAQCGVLF
jgi:hypothetical protein